MRRLCLAGSALLVASSAACAGAPCGYAPIDPAHPGLIAGRSLDFGPADDAAHPTAWQGPLGIAAAASRCTVDPDVGIIERPVFSDGAHLLITTYSGSNRTLYAVDLATCHVLWQSAPFAGDVSLRNGVALRLGQNSVRLGAQCVPEARKGGSAAGAR